MMQDDAKAKAVDTAERDAVAKAFFAERGQAADADRAVQWLLAREEETQR